MARLPRRVLTVNYGLRRSRLRTLTALPMLPISELLKQHLLFGGSPDQGIHVIDSKISGLPIPEAGLLKISVKLKCCAEA
jgi:hypothetical protein